MAAKIYADYLAWPRIFPTISSVRLIGEDGAKKTLELQHSEGTVINTLQVLRGSSQRHEVVLGEWKRAYDAVFINVFDAIPGQPGACALTIIADIRLKGWRSLLSPLVRPYARRLMWRLQMAPMKAAAERQREAGP